jgi:hypothetical protein
MELTITSGMDTAILIAVNFIPKKDASNIVIGILHMAEAPI